MTLIVSLINKDQCIQVSDRRLTSNGKIVDEEESKGILLTTSDARLTVAFTGLARAGSFSTRKWLIDQLYELAPPDFTAQGIISRLAEAATKQFKENRALSALKGTDKALSIMFSGYLYTESPPLGVNSVITNNTRAVPDLIVAPDGTEFYVQYSKEQSPREEIFSYIGKAGYWSAPTSRDYDILRTLLIRGATPGAILRTCEEIFHTVSESFRSGGTVGKQLNSIVIPRDQSQAPWSNYHSAVAKHETYMPDFITAISPHQHTIFTDVKIEAVNKENTSSIVVPRVGPNKPCPCGSGKKYKKCHGRRF